MVSELSSPMSSGWELIRESPWYLKLHPVHVLPTCLRDREDRVDTPTLGIQKSGNTGSRDKM